MTRRSDFIPPRRRAGFLFAAAVLLAFLMAERLAASDPPGWSVTLQAGGTKTETARINNRCQSPHEFRLDAEDARFLRFSRPVSAIRIPAAGSVDVPVVFDASGLRPGRYPGRINVVCNSCQTDPGCTQDRNVIPVELNVVEPLRPEGVSARGGLLAFDSQEAFENLLSTLERLDRESIRRPGGSTVYEELEASLSHRSLRQSITEREERAAESGLLGPENDADSFFIQDESLRTLLNDRLEIQIGRSIFQVREPGLTVEVPSGDVEILERLRSGADPFTLGPAVRLHRSPDSAQRSSRSRSDCFAGFSFQVEDRTVTFTNQSLPTSGLDYSWTFGDGDTSNEKEPRHVYSQVGDYNVCLQVIEPQPSDCSNTFCQFVTVEQQDTGCCDANDRVKEKWTSYAGGSRSFKSVLWQTNLPFYHRWGAKTVNYSKNSKGRWERSSAENVSVQGDGTLYFIGLDGSRCARSEPTQWSDNHNDRPRAHFSVPAGRKFWTKRNSLVSLHSVTFEGKEIFGTPLSLTEDCPRRRECRKECREQKSGCKTVCKDTLHDCKDVCTEEKTTCVDSCPGKGLKKWKCKRECRKEKRSCKRECKVTKRECKETCSSTTKVCKKACR